MIYLQTPPLYEEFIQVDKYLKSQQNRSPLIRITGKFEEDMIFKKPNSFKDYKVKIFNINNIDRTSSFNPIPDMVRLYKENRTEFDRLFPKLSKGSSGNESSED